MDKFILNITASSGEFYQGDCESLTLPTSDGVYGVQAGHNPVLVALHMGLMHFTVNGEEHEVLVGDGIAEVTPTFVLLLVDSAERPEDIDRNRAEAARIRAAERLQHKQSMHEYYQTKMTAPCSVCRPRPNINADAPFPFYPAAFPHFSDKRACPCRTCGGAGSFFASLS